MFSEEFFVLQESRLSNLRFLKAQNSAELRYPQETLNSVEVESSPPDHNIPLKNGFIVKLLRKLKPSIGHANGTRYIVENMTLTCFF